MGRHTIEAINHDKTIVPSDELNYFYARLSDHETVTVKDVETYGRHSLWAKGYAMSDNLPEFYDTLDDPNACVGLHVVSLRKPRHAWERLFTSDSAMCHMEDHGQGKWNLFHFAAVEK